MTYRFGPFVADRATYRVSEGNRQLDLTPKLLDLLFYLLDRPATLVTKEELLEGVWPGANVTDNALAQAVSDLRDALDDSPASPKYIRTVARRGYRFVAPIEAAQPTASPTATTASPTPSASATVTRQTDPHAVAVLDFVNVTGDPDVAWLSAGIAETVASDLTALDHFRVIDRWRLAQAARLATGSLHETASAVGAGLVVTGSFQRSGSHVRVTARLVNLVSGEALADAKIDGVVHDVFSLQDGIVAAFARELGLMATRGPARVGVRETSSLDAYRAYTEGWLKIESLNTELVAASIHDFERAIALDPRYAVAYTGLANAEFVAYEMTRSQIDPNRTALASGVEHARHAIELDSQLAEAHATLSFLLSSAQKFDDARAAAHTAVLLEPDSWRHQYRLGHASWGDARLRAFERTLALYPQFAYATFEMAMVFVARGDLDAADAIVRRGVTDQDRQTGNRFPAIGFHCILGALNAARGQSQDAIVEFDRELENVSTRRLYGPEYGALTSVARGLADLQAARMDEAHAAFARARTFIEDYPRAWLGDLAASLACSDRQGAERARQQVQSARNRLDRGARRNDVLLFDACVAAVERDADAAFDRLSRLFDTGPRSVVGWNLPIEPWFTPLHGDSRWTALLSRLADRAR